MIKALFFISLLHIATTACAEPSIVPGLDPGGVGVAILGGGIDYTKPKIASRLARDGEGNLIAWDFADNDARPYTTDVTSNDDAISLINAGSKLRLIIVKERPDDPVAIGRMAAFAHRTPARIIYCPDAMLRKDWAIFKQAVALFRDRLFIIVQYGEIQPQLAEIPNLVIAEHDQVPNARKISFTIIAKAVEILTRYSGLTAETLKMRLKESKRYID